MLENLRQRARIPLPFLAALVLAAAATVSVHASCPVPNGTFDTSVTGWTNAFFDGAHGNPPGSTIHGPVNAGLCEPAFSACIPFAAGETCNLTAQVFFANGQPADGTGFTFYHFYSDPNCTAFLKSSAMATTSSANQGSWVQLATGPVVAPASAQSAQAILNVCAGATSGLVGNFDNVVSSPGGCAPSSTALCLNGGRFKVTATFDAGSSGTGDAQVVQLTPDTGYLWFFASANVEAIVKVLNGCGLGGHYWVFAGGLTNVKVVLTVTDTQTNTARTYTNPPNTTFQPIQDTSAFATCP